MPSCHMLRVKLGKGKGLEMRYSEFIHQQWGLQNDRLSVRTYQTVCKFLYGDTSTLTCCSSLSLVQVLGPPLPTSSGRGRTVQLGLTPHLLLLVSLLSSNVVLQGWSLRVCRSPSRRLGIIGGEIAVIYTSTYTYILSMLMPSEHLVPKLLCQVLNMEVSSDSLVCCCE